MKNIQTQGLVQELKKKSIEEKVAIWKRIATDLEKPTRQRRIVNLFSLDKNAKDNEVVVVPGKVLGTGNISKKITVAAYTISKSAEEKLKSSGSSTMSIYELLEKNPKGKNVRILG
jgi:large subunit ribosomal protein L18e